MKKLTLQEQLNRIKVLMSERHHYNEPTEYSEGEDDYADETYGDERPQGEEMGNEEGPDEATIENWYNSLDIDNLMNNAGWEVVETEGLVSKKTRFGGRSNEQQFDDYSNMHITYTIAPDYETDKMIVIRFDADIIDSWPEQKQGLEQEPIQGGYDMGRTGITIEQPIQKYLEGEELAAFEKLNPNFINWADENISETTVGEYDGDI